MTLIKYNNKPFFSNFIDKFLEDDINLFAGRDHNNNVPSVNIQENDNEFILEVAAPGLSKEDFKLDIDNDVLTIAAIHQEGQEQEEKNYRRKEFGYTSFKRSFSLPETIDKDAVKATYEKGILTINIPKREEVKPKKREISIS